MTLSEVKQIIDLLGRSIQKCGSYVRAGRTLVEQAISDKGIQGEHERVAAECIEARVGGKVVLIRRYQGQHLQPNGTSFSVPAWFTVVHTIYRIVNMSHVFQARVGSRVVLISWYQGQHLQPNRN